MRIARGAVSIDLRWTCVSRKPYPGWLKEESAFGAMIALICLLLAVLARRGHFRE
jgi:hypothetical protein